MLKKWLKSFLCALGSFFHRESSQLNAHEVSQMTNLLILSILCDETNSRAIQSSSKYMDYIWKWFVADVLPFSNDTSFQRSYDLSSLEVVCLFFSSFQLVRSSPFSPRFASSLRQKMASFQNLMDVLESDACDLVPVQDSNTGGCIRTRDNLSGEAAP